MTQVNQLYPTGRSVLSRRSFLRKSSALAAAGVLGAPFIQRAWGATPLTLKLAHSGSEDWQGNYWAKAFAQILAETLPGSQVQLFPNAQLGQDPALAQAVKLGTLDINVNGPVLEQYIPSLAVFDMPFLFKDLEATHKVQDGPIGTRLKQDCADAGFHLLGWVDIGMRNVTNNRRPINTVADFKGLKLRVPPGKIFVATFEALGASVQSVNFGELYTALQQGVVDGEENPATTVRVMKFYEVQKYYSLTRHIASFTCAVMNLALYQKQPDEVRKILDEAGAAATQRERAFVATDEAQSLEFCKQRGVIVNEPTDRESLVKATRSVADQASPEVAALAREIMAKT